MIEECAELIAALKHYKRGRIGENEVVEELADVNLMLGQLSWMLGTEKVDQAITAKLNKLDRLLNANDEGEN